MATSRTTLPRRTSRTARAAVVALVAGAGMTLFPSAAVATPTAVPTSLPSVSAYTSSWAAQRAVQTALAQVGKPYAWGGGGPGSFDCSGLTQYAYASAGISLPHSSRMQSTMGVPVGLWSLQPGDLLFYYNPVGHVTMYIGDGKMIHASTTGKPVSVVWAGSLPGFVGAVRVA